MGLETDVSNPLGNKSYSYTMWPVLLVPYNLSPQNMMNSFYMMINVSLNFLSHATWKRDWCLFASSNQWIVVLMGWRFGCIWCIYIQDVSITYCYGLSNTWILSIWSDMWVERYYKACPICLENTMSCRLWIKMCYTTIVDS